MLLPITSAKRMLGAAAPRSNARYAWLAAPLLAAALAGCGQTAGPARGRAHRRAAGHQRSRAYPRSNG